MVSYAVIGPVGGHHSPPLNIILYRSPPPTITQYYSPPPTTTQYYSPPPIITQYYSPPPTITQYYSPPLNIILYRSLPPTITQYYSPPLVNNSKKFSYISSSQFSLAQITERELSAKYSYHQRTSSEWSYAQLQRYSDSLYLPSLA